MQNGPRFLTDSDINTAYIYTNLTPGSGVGQTGTGLTVDLTQLGQIGQTGDGRFYRLCSIGGTSTVAPGTLLIAPATGTNFAGLAIPSTQPSNTAQGNTSTGVSALQQGSLSFNVTNGGNAAITADQFAGGYVEVLQTSGTSEGPVAYKLRGNTADASSGHNGTVTLYLAEPLNQPEKLVAGTDTVTLTPCPYKGVAASGTLGQAIGVLTVQAPNTATNTYAAWVQTRGRALVANKGAITLGYAVKQSSTSGDVAVTSAATDVALGQAVEAASGDGTVAVELNIP